MASKFELLLQLAQDRLEAAADRMRRAQQALDGAHARLAQLQGYIDDYQQQMVAAGSRGMGMERWLDFRVFMDKLTDAREQQQREVERATQRLMLERQGWMNERKKLKAFETLCARERAAERQRQQRREQKALDEFSSRQFQARRNES